MPSPTPDAPISGAQRSWRDALALYVQPASWRMLLLGFSAGLPLLLVLGTLSFRLREAGIDRSTIGYLSWVGLAYGFKWVWAPLVDRLPLPGLTRALGRRRSWLLASQLLLALGLVGMAWSDPAQQLAPLVACALLVAFASATQDIALDAYRIELVAEAGGIRWIDASKATNPHAADASGVLPRRVRRGDLAAGLRDEDLLEGLELLDALAGAVGHRRQRVTREDWQGNRFR